MAWGYGNSNRFNYSRYRGGYNRGYGSRGGYGAGSSYQSNYVRLRNGRSYKVVRWTATGVYLQGRTKQFWVSKSQLSYGR